MLKWLVLENITIILVVAILFYLTRSHWVFLLLLFVNLWDSHAAKETL